MRIEQYARILNETETLQLGLAGSHTLVVGGFNASERIRTMALTQWDAKTFRFNKISQKSPRGDSSIEKILIEAGEKEAFARGGRHFIVVCDESDIDWIHQLELIGYRRVLDSPLQATVGTDILLERDAAHLVDLVSPETLSRRMPVQPCETLPTGAFEILLLYHPVEIDKESNTGHVVQRWLPDHTQEMIWHRHTVEAQLSRLSEDYEIVLLFPSETAVPLSAYKQKDFEQSLGDHGSVVETSKPLRLLVIDATWQQATKIMAQSPSLRTLPQVTLEQVPKSRYVLRKNQKSEGLCTLEAIAEAIDVLGYPQGKRHLLEGFNQWLAMGIARYGIRRE